MAQLAELRAAMATAGSALMALGIGLVILAATSAKENHRLNALGWGLVILGAVLLLASVIWTIRIARRNPEVVIECGTGEDFFREVGSECHTRLRVRETKDVRASDVHVQVVSALPRGTLGDPGQNAVRPGLEWVDGTTYTDLPGKGRAYVRLCQRKQRWNGGAVTTSIPSLKPGAIIVLELDVIVGQQRAGRFKFVVDWLDDDADYPEVSVA
jgi:hypothetical protein